MLGTLINIIAVLAGTLAGVAIGSRLPQKMRETVLHGLGLLTLLIGLQMGLGAKNILVVLGAVLSGGILGEVLKIHDRLEKLGAFFQSVFSRGEGSTFAQGFVTSSLIFCIGPMAILGSIQDGLSGDYRLLAIKSTLDGFAAIAFSAAFGWGVALSALSLLVYQGGITLFAGVFSKILTEPMMTEMTAAGGVIIIGIGVKLLDLKEIRLANFLPALAIAPLLVYLIPLVKGLF